MRVEPAVPGRHQLFCLIAGCRQQVEHPSWPPTAGASLGVSGDGSLLLKEFQRLLQNGLGEPQLGLFTGQFLQQSGGIVVILQEAFENPADSKFQIEELWWRLLEVLLDIRKAVARGLSSGEQSGCVAFSMKVDLILRFKREF